MPACHSSKLEILNFILCLCHVHGALMAPLWNIYDELKILSSLMKAMIGENWQLVTNEPVEFEK